MKSRIGFVSNSSSSSFVLDLNEVTPRQRLLIGEHIREILSYLGKYKTQEEWEAMFPGSRRADFDYIDDGDAWSQARRGDKLCVWTWMDNFPMWSFLKLIGVPESAILESREFAPGWVNMWDKDGEGADG